MTAEKIELKLGEILEAEKVIKEFFEFNFTPSTSLKIFRNYESLKKYQSFAENERVKLVKKFGVQNPDTSEIVVASENEPAFFSSYAALLDEKVDLEFFEISLMELGDIPVSPKAIAAIGSMIREIKNIK